MIILIIIKNLSTPGLTNEFHYIIPLHNQLRMEKNYSVIDYVLLNKG